ncbi:MAG: hypothetical protein E6K98_04915 [Thaumarchaeota archaeon]|nr:MAG: hypothetical protein E6K98_04915 [Nitrososphaerota archaeon]
MRSERPSYVIWTTESPQEGKFGIEITDGHLNFNLQEYYRDFKNGVNKYYTKLKNWKKNQTTLGNFLKATVINFNHDKKLRLEDFKPDEEP